MSVQWMGDQLRETVVGAVVSGLNEYGARTETAAKSSLKPGRGVLTGTYRRSIHSGPPSYNYGGDDVKPSNNTPERGGQGGGEVDGDSVRILIGSGMRYAMRLEQRYNVIAGAQEKTAGQLPGILQKHAKAAGLT